MNIAWGSVSCPVAVMAVVFCMVLPCSAAPDRPTGVKSSRLGSAGSIIAVRRASGSAHISAAASVSGTGRPRPRLVGFSPQLVAVSSDKKSLDDIDYEHDIELAYAGNPLVPPAGQRYVVGVLDSGSVADLALGSGAAGLGLTGPRLTGNFVEFGGAGGTTSGQVTHPLGIFGNGFSAVDPTGLLRLDQVVGHSNVAMAVLPSLNCGFEESFTAIIGTAFLSFFNSVIRVDTPRRITLNGTTFTSPDVQLQRQTRPLPDFAHGIAMEIGGLLPVLTASYYIDVNLDPEDPGFLTTPASPTALSLLPLTQAFGAVYFTSILMAEGEPGPTNLPITARMLMDTGAQSSIISPGLAANLNLPREPDFTIDVCGVGGIVSDIPGYYIDYVKINAFGGALEFAKAPFVVLDLSSPEGGPLDGVLGMNFFWNRNVIFEPSLTGSSFFHVSDPVAIPFADFDLDLDVDDADAFFALACAAGPGELTPSAECDHLDADLDDDVDLRDFARFQNCYSGDNTRSNALCGS